MFIVSEWHCCHAKALVWPVDDNLAGFVCGPNEAFNQGSILLWNSYLSLSPWYFGGRNFRPMHCPSKGHPMRKRQVVVVAPIAKRIQVKDHVKYTVFCRTHLTFLLKLKFHYRIIICIWTYTVTLKNIMIERVVSLNEYRINNYFSASLHFPKSA